LTGWLAAWLPSELMNDPSNTHLVWASRTCIFTSPITGSGGSARLARQMSSTFSYSWTGSRPLGLSQIQTRNEKEGRGAFTALSLSLFPLTMSSSFSAYDFDDVPHTVTSTRYQSFIDLSPSPNSSYHTHTRRSSRTRSGSVGSENSTTPLHTQRSSIRINTNLMVRICVSNSLFPTPTPAYQPGPSLF
jgi:hypothetical protein